MNLYEAIFVRKSVRNYCFDTLPPQTLDKIWEHYKEMPALFSGIGVDMAILDNRKGQERMLSMFSVKAPYYMAFYSEESERYLMNVGYIMEQMVLYLCSIGLGTCFIGSNRVKKAELEKNGKRLVGIVAFGKSHGSHTRRQSEAKRLPLEDLCVFKEVPRAGARPAVLRGLAVTGGVITSAGLVLAATFAALFVIPLVFMAQIAFMVAFGVLLDTFVVRALLVSGLAFDLGRASWWPSRFADRPPRRAKLGS